jgi:putative transposase
MTSVAYSRHRFPPDVIRHAVWLYLRFTFSYRDVSRQSHEIVRMHKP